LARAWLAQEEHVVATVMSNLGLDHAIHQAGGEVLRTQVGDRYVIEKMLQDDLNVGGEQSGHMIFRDFTPPAMASLARCKCCAL